MNILKLMTFPELLEQHFLTWQAQQGKRKTLDDYAEYLGVGRPILSLWLSGKRSPGTDSLRVLSAKLGPEVYDVLGLDRPDPDLAYITQHWEELDPDTRRRLRAQTEKYAAQNDMKRSSKKRKNSGD